MSANKSNGKDINRHRQSLEGQPAGKRLKTEASDVSLDENLHRAFIEAIFELGMKNASPSVILENMLQNPENLTSERVKSHLQKFRKNKDKSNEEFMAEYDEWLRKSLKQDKSGNKDQKEVVFPLLGGHAAAYLTYKMLGEDKGEVVQLEDEFDGGNASVGAQEYLNYFSGLRIEKPRLTEEEKKTPLGQSIEHVLAMFDTLASDHLTALRHAKGEPVEAKSTLSRSTGMLPTMSHFNMNEMGEIFDELGAGDKKAKAENDSSNGSNGRKGP